ncbi:MAG: hypothetical protein A2527_08835 [Candidatus Lambdaproteobacteria bacterium RIFOXYD2_FULL_50_16]|uniref:GMC family oxidoreductase n=1 Tax=Candidatus Lambdaproteobacteria bacterium RIFOXYD2_FULL_50_16 TaxID=1817772 RepID=A0A1F6GAX8_9PROT|nr:MAG: hypothetical protein A2527_08835 [Candidatus Lambdaproteobacteria bacterium RIFOXYD2_FULL_50_16]
MNITQMGVDRLRAPLDASALAKDLYLETEVVVIGSGAGGLVAAEALAKAGILTLLVEEGDWVGPQDFHMLESEAYPRLYQESASRKTADKAIKILQGKGVGGSTLVNWASCFRPPQTVLDYWRTELGITGTEALAAPLDRLEKRLNVNAWDNANANNQKLEEGCQKLGYRWGVIKRNVAGCLDLGYCGMGCPLGAKQDLARTLLPDFLAAKGKLLYRAKALKLVEKGGQIDELLAQAVEGSGLGPAQIRIKAQVYVCAAGAISGPGLMLASHLPDPHNQLGRRTFLHPVNISGAFFSEPIDAFAGAPQSRYSDHFINAAPLGFKLEVPPVHPILAATTLDGFGPEFRAKMERFNHLQVMLALHKDGFHADAPGGQVRLNDYGRPVLDYPITPTLWESFFAAYEAMGEIQFAAGAQAVLPIHEQAKTYKTMGELKTGLAGLERAPLMARLASAHVMGGCALSPRPETGVINLDGRHHQLENLWVADGSVLPTSLGVNPQMTVFALATKIADALAKELRPSV